jgi:hypothetical protein
LAPVIVAPDDSRSDPLWKVAQKGCSGELVPDSEIISKAGLHGPVRVFKAGPTNRIIVEEDQCKNPADDLLFAIGEVVNHHLTYFVTRSNVGTIMRAIQAVNGHSEIIDQIIPDMERDFERIKSELIKYSSE